MTRWYPALLAVALFAGACGASNAHGLSDADALNLAKEFLDGEDYGSIPLGDLRYYERGQLRKNATDHHVSALRLAESAQVRGYIDIDGYRDLTRAFSGWDDFFVLSQAGIRHVATVSPSSKALADPRFQKRTANGSEELRFLVGRRHVSELVANQALESNTDKYSLVSVVVVAERLDDELLKIWEPIRGELRNLKWQVLYKFDPFQRRWILAGSDAANLDKPFEGIDFAATLKELRPVGR